jgi:HupE / UreJ protein
VRLFIVIACLFFVVLPEAAHAHAANTSYLKIEAPDTSGPVRLVWDLNAADLDWTVDLDLDANGFVTWGEVQERRDAIATLALQSLQVQRGGNACTLSMDDLALTRHTDATFISLALRAQCQVAGPLAVSSSLFFSQDAAQRVLVDARLGQQSFNTVISPQAQRWEQPAQASALQTFWRFVQQGVVHVWVGYDHIAFVLLLVLPSVLRSSPQGWRSASGTREITRDLLGVITTFTVAHSVTLSLAATRIVVLPERPVEVAIAASIVAAGLLNLRPTATRWRLAIAFGFGLMHGFGFARALLEINTTGAGLLPMLAGFNVGVEIAQLVIVLIALPLLLRLRGYSFYAARLMPAASVLTAAAGVVWMVTRFRA